MEEGAGTSSGRKKGKREKEHTSFRYPFLNSPLNASDMDIGGVQKLCTYVILRAAWDYIDLLVRGKEGGREAAEIERFFYGENYLFYSSLFREEISGSRVLEQCRIAADKKEIGKNNHIRKKKNGKTER